MPVRDSWDRDEWGRLRPGACIRYFVPPPAIPFNAYVAEDGITPYTTEDGRDFYVTE